MRFEKFLWVFQFLIYAILLRWFALALLAATVISARTILSVFRLSVGHISKTANKERQYSEIRHALYGSIFLILFSFCFTKIDNNLDGIAEEISSKCNTDNLCQDSPYGFQSDWRNGIWKRRVYEIGFWPLTMEYIVHYETNGKNYSLGVAYMPDRGNFRNSGVGKNIKKSPVRGKINDT